MAKRTLKNCGRPKAFWGALIANAIPALIGAGASIIQSRKQAQLAREQAEQQRKLQEEANAFNQANAMAASLNNYANVENQQTTDEEDYGIQYSNGGKRRLRTGGVRITDGGVAIPIDYNTFLLRGSLHSEVNESGKTGIGIKVGNKEIEAQDGEVAQIKGKELRIYSNEPKQGGSYAERVINGENKDKVFATQQRNNKHYTISSPVGNRRKAELGARFTTPDYIGLGTNTLASILANAYATRAYNDAIGDINFTLPEYYDESYVAGPTTWHNEAQRANIERNRNIARRSIARNTASSSVALNRMQEADTNAIYDQNKLWDEKANKETEMRQANVEREQQVRARNAENRNRWAQAIAETRNKQLATRLALAQDRINSNVGMIQGIGSSIGNFLQQGIDNYQNQQARLAYLAASPYGTAERLASLGYKFDKDTIAGIQRDNKYVMSQYADDTTAEGIRNYRQAQNRYNFWNNYGFDTTRNKQRRTLRNPADINNNRHNTISYGWYSNGIV